MSYGKLYIVATPIGNLGDITIRALETLKSVDIIAAEDTRHSLKLLNHFEIKKPLTSYYEHNKQYKGNVVVSKLKEGKDVALVSDAGTPVISDPGAELVKECIENNIEVVTVPGACAAISAVTLCGFLNKRFSFIGFLPVKKNEKIKELEKFKNYETTLVFYEAPHKLLKTLEAIYEVFGTRNISVARELTKKYEQVVRTTTDEAVKYFAENEPVGEFVICVEGCEEAETDNELNSLSVEEHIKHYIENGLSKKDAVKKCAEDRGVPKREIYNASIDLEL